MKLKSYIKKFLLLYFLYFIITFVLIFAFHKKMIPIDNNYNKYINHNISVDRALIVEEKEFSAICKVQLIDSAKETLDISYYKIQRDKAGDFFFAKIIEAANRGVKVKIILDGKINKIPNDINGLNNLLVNHPNIEIKYYEPFNLLKPWTFNNIMHDKYIIVDKEIAILGGRNIGNQYFSMNKKSLLITNDREVLVINTNKDKYSNSVISQLETYFNDVWSCKYSKSVRDKTSKSQINKAKEKELKLNKQVALIESEYPKLFNSKIGFFEYVCFN